MDAWNVSDVIHQSRLALYTILVAVVVYATFKISSWLMSFCQIRLNLRRYWQGPQSHWFWGHLGMVTKGNKDPKRFITFFTEKEKAYPVGFTIYIGPLRAALMLYHPNAVKEVLCATAHEAPKDPWAYSNLNPWLGQGLLVLNGQKWFRHRRLLTSAFHFDILKPYVKIMNECSKTLVNKWLSQINAEKRTKVEIFEHASLLTLDNILQCLMSYKSDCQLHAKKNCYVSAIYELSRLLVSKQRSKDFRARIEFLYRRTEDGRAFQRECDVVHAFSETMIDLRLEEQKEGNAQRKRNYLDFLDMLLQAKDADGKGLSHEEVRAEVDTFLFEGHDTTASAIAWTLYCMALNPDHQQLCYDEITRVLGSREDVKWADLSSLHHLTRCIKESLRMYPPVPVVIRQLNKDISVCGRKILKGTTVQLSIIGVQRNPDFWKDPQTFNPDRFTIESSAMQNNHAFIPFASGPRNCIGQHLAMHEIKIALCHLLRKFRVSIDDDVEVVHCHEVIYRARGGLQLTIEER